MRAFSSFVGGLVVAALIFGAWFFISDKQKTASRPMQFDPSTAIPINPVGTYQLVHGKVIDAAGQDADIIMRIDTATGRTWECRVELNKGLFWRALTDDPLTNPTRK